MKRAIRISVFPDDGGGQRRQEAVWLGELGAERLRALLAGETVETWPVGAVYIGTAGSPALALGGTWVDRGKVPSFNSARYYERTA